jgi:Ran GTPase-activating protein (RanGAP) involved in mRNA processing and transport
MNDVLRRLAAHDGTLATLDLSNNSIGPLGARALAEALRHTAAPLRELDLSHSQQD